MCLHAYVSVSQNPNKPFLDYEIQGIMRTQTCHAAEQRAAHWDSTGDSQIPTVTLTT